MKKLITLLFMIINTIASAEVYYLAPTGGNDSNPGTISQPWATWSKAIRMAYPGDTVYIRGGKYYHTSSSGVTIIPDDGIGRAGTKTQPISYIGYPPDVLSGNKPIIDCIGYPTDVSYMQGMRLRKNANYIILKDFDIINVIQSPTAPGFHNGLYIAGSNNVTVINVTVRNIGGAGFGVSGDSITFINCDAWYCTDPYTTTNPYGAGDGWQIASDWQRYTTWLIGCRAIHCSDDGYDNYWNDGYVFYDSCWALGNGYDSNFKIYGPTGAGNGFKLGPNLRLFATGTVQRSMENCISVDNRSIGYTENCLGKCTMLQNYYNNISYRNGYAGYSNFRTNDGCDYYARTYRNNISYLDGAATSFLELTGLVQDHNTWNIGTGVTVTTEDFISLDTAQLYAPRQADGSLPSVNFMHLAEGSDLIDAGIDVGLSFSGSSPDIGWFEKSSTAFPPAVPIYVSASIQNNTPARLEMTYNLTLANIVPAPSAFIVRVNNAARSVSSVSISGTKVLLTLSTPVVFGDAVTVAYMKPASNPIQTTSGGQAASITAQNVINNVATVNPVYVSSVIENATPSRLEMTYNLTLANIVPAASAFAVKVNTLTRTVNSVAISGTKVLLTLASPVVYGDAVTVAYTKPASNPIQTTSGGQAVSITAQNVTNNVAAVNPVYVSSVIENATPSRLEITYNLTLANIVPAASAFTVRVNYSDRTVTSVAISATKVLLTLSSPVVYDDLVTVAYTKPLTNPLQTSSGGQAASISAQSVNNNCRLPSNQPPVADILSPAKSSSFTAPATIILDVNASDPDGTITKVEFFNGTIKIGETSTSPYLFTWKDVPAGTYSITVAATDNLNARSVSAAITIVVTNVTTSVNQLPLVNITSPENNISIIVPSSVTLTADATDVDGSISKVEFYLDDTKIAEDFTSPYTIPLECIKAGSYELKAVAIDDLNAATISSIVTLHAALDNKPDAISLYPNPNDGRFTITLLTDLLIAENRIIITRGNGKIVYSGVLLKVENTRQFDLSYLESGVYVIMIFTDRLVYTKKFIKK